MADKVRILETMHSTKKKYITMHFMPRTENALFNNFFATISISIRANKNLYHHMVLSTFLTCIENPNLAEDSWQNILVLITELLDQAVDGAPGGDHQVCYGEVHQVVVHGCSK